MPAPKADESTSDGHVPAGEACATLTVDLAALTANWRTAAALSAPSQCAAVVKGNAYGLGLKPVVTALSRAGARTFFTATICEARQVRAVTGTGPAIYVLNGLLPGSAPVFAAHALRPVLGSVAEIAEWREAGGGPAALHVDTGMNRHGVDVTDVPIIAANPGFEITLVMTHMACADAPAHPLNMRQIERFETVRMAFPGVPASLANTGSIAWLKCAGDYDLARPGIGLYGGEPIAGHHNPFRPVATLTAPVLQVREVAAGESVGYGATWTAKHDSRIAVVGLGYADGFHRAASAANGARPYHAMIGDTRVPLVGRVNMDLLTFDVSAVSGVVRGSAMTVLGGPIPLSETAAHFGTSVYEVLALLGPRYARRYVEGA